MPRPCGQKMVSSDSSWVWATLRSPGSGHRRRCGTLDTDGNLVGGDDVAAQARATLENIGAILEAVGAMARTVASGSPVVSVNRPRAWAGAVRSKTGRDEPPIK